MLKKTITSHTFDEQPEEIVADYYFNLSESELYEMELGTKGGLEFLLNEIVVERDTPRMIQFFKDLILKSYGKRTADGIGFQKSDEISKEFMQTDAYNVLFQELLTGDFLQGILPKKIREAANDDTTKDAIKGLKERNAAIAQLIDKAEPSSTEE